MSDADEHFRSFLKTLPPSGVIYVQAMEELDCRDFGYDKLAADEIKTRMYMRGRGPIELQPGYEEVLDLLADAMEALFWCKGENFQAGDDKRPVFDRIKEIMIVTGRSTGGLVDD